jgi:T-complex protein 1 subunit zeta
VITEGYELARRETLTFLETFKHTHIDKATLINVAKTALNTKLLPDVANNLVEVIVDAVQIVEVKDQPIDLFMVEIMHMTHKMATETKLIRGLVLDHGARH